MKNRYFYITLLCATLFASCSDNFLQREPAGSTINSEQYYQISDRMEGTLRGIYTMLYDRTSDDHAWFGKRSIDLQTDLLSGDIALTNNTYGWFEIDERMLTAQYRTGTYWSYYYSILHNVNSVIQMIRSGEDIAALVSEYGLPNDPACTYEYTDAQKERGYYYAVALALRGYVYSYLTQFYIPLPSTLSTNGFNVDTYPSIILYTEDNMDAPRGTSFAAEAFDQIERDFTTSIDYFEAFEDGGSRLSKDEVDVNVAKALYAYSQLNRALYYIGYDDVKASDILSQAATAATEVIESGEYSIIPEDQLLKTGFNNIDNASWIWGQQTSTETTGGLASFFGHVDIYTYSYAWSGDKKVIDQGLYDQIPEWDKRMLWFAADTVFDGERNGCPYRKFFSSENSTSVAADDLDRRWLADNVYLRIETMYLIAAEAYWRMGDYGKAAKWLTLLTDKRKNPTVEDVETLYSNYKTSLSDVPTLYAAIYYNWRIELWGEGYGLQTFRRMETGSRKRGANHLRDSGTDVQPADQKFYFNIPSSETTYNPNFK